MANRTLFLIRHGLAGEHGSYANDNERPLTEAGRKKTKQVAKKLANLEIHFDLIQTSPLVRARQTAEILMEAGLSQELEEAACLANGDLEEWLPWLDNHPSDKYQRLALVGHEPSLSQWAEVLIWGAAPGRMQLKKAGIIGLLLPEAGSPIGQSVLFWLTPPKFLTP